MERIKRIIITGFLLFASWGVSADNNTSCSNSQNCYNSGIYVYEDDQDLINLYSMSGTTNLNSNDDSWSAQVSLGMEWDRWGQTWSHARMSTNGCVNLTSGSAGGTSANCQDYTPQSLPYRDFTLYPFWTDLIRKNTSKMLFKDFGNYVVFGWYYLKEYNRSSNNSFEAILYDNNSFEYRYRELDIKNHDVLIGEQGKHSTHPEYTKTYLYYNDGQSGYGQLDNYLGGYGGPDIENGGSLFSGSFESMCEINQLYSSNCSGYAAAYLAQQCALDTLYNSACPGYAAAYLTQQCALNTLYDEECTGYAAALLIYECDLDVFYSTQCDGYASALAQEEALYDAIYGTDDDYGYDDGSDDGSDYGYDEYGNAYAEEDLWYDEGYDEYLDPNDPCYENACADFTDADWYALDIEQFGQEQVDEWYGQDVEFSDEGYIDYGTSTEEEYWTNIDEGMNEYDQEQQEMYDSFTEEDWYAYDVEEFGQEQVDEWYGTEVEFTEDGTFAYEEEQYYEEEQFEEEYYEELYRTDEEWYAIDLEEFGQEQVDEWYGEDVSFTEDGTIPETHWEEMYEDELVTQNLTQEEIYVLEEEGVIEIFTEEEWAPSEENEIYEEVLEDYEREAMEEHEEEVFEEFDEAYEEEELYIEEDEAFEDLIDEEELEELINEEQEEEFFEEDEQEEEEQEESKQIYAGPTSSGPAPTGFKQEQQTFTVMMAQQEQQEQQQTIQQAVSQDSSSSSSQAVVAEIDFGGTQEQQQTVAEVIQEQLDDGSGSNTGGSFDANSYSSGSSSNSGSFVSTSSQQEQITQSTGNTFIAEQQEQSTGQVQIQAAEVVDSGPAVTAFEVAEQQQETQEEQQELTFDDGSNFATADQNFESSFDDALGSGQSIGQFLSNQQPNFAKFDVAPPTIDEQQVTTAVESLADRMGSQVAAQNLQEQLGNVQQGGGFDVDQTATVAYIGYKSGFSEYTGQEQLADKDDWYISKTMYKGNKIKDNDLSFYMMAGRTQGKLQKMIDSQYK